MTSDRKAAVMAGLMFLIADITGMLSAVLAGPVMGAPNYIAQVSANTTPLTMAGLLEFMMGAACAGIAISMYPVLKRRYEGLSLGAVGFGVLEGALFMVASVCLLSTVTVGRELASIGIMDVPYLQALGAAIKAMHSSAYDLAGIPFGIGALMYYYIFYRTRLVPRWLAWWGLISVMLCLVESFTAMFRLIGPTFQYILIAPLGVEEIVLAVWLITKGFHSSEIRPETIRG
jgi:hypothetical protein